MTKISYSTKMSINFNLSTDEARKMNLCPCCDEKKDLGLVVCWDCFNFQPKHSAVEMTGFKQWNGSLAKFIATSHIPF